MQGSQGAGAGGGSGGGGGGGAGGGSSSSRHGGYPGRANGVASNNLGVGAGAGLAYGGMPAGYVFNNWVGYGNYQMQSLMPMPPVVPRSYGRGSASHAFVPLGVQGAGILKRPSGPPQGQSVHGRSSRNRGHNGRSWASRDRDRKNLTKEALDADLDEYRMKDKKFGGQSLDAELDEYWKKKDDSDMLPEEDELKDSGKVAEVVGLETLALKMGRCLPEAVVVLVTAMVISSLRTVANPSLCPRMLRRSAMEWNGGHASMVQV